jgi:hypothetical protein
MDLEVKNIIYKEYLFGVEIEAIQKQYNTRSNI